MKYWKLFPSSCPVCFLFSLPPRLYAHRGHGCGAEAPGPSARSPAGLRAESAQRGAPASREAAPDLAPPAADSRQSCAALLQHQTAGQGSHA